MLARGARGGSTERRRGHDVRRPGAARRDGGRRPAPRSTSWRIPRSARKLRPTHPYGCKRPLISNVYYPAFNQPNLELVTEPHRAHHAERGRDRRRARRARSTRSILATGFATTKYLSAIDVVGRGGRRIDDAWNDGAQAYLGITTAGFPNLFMLYGPNTNNGSILTMIESQVEHVIAPRRAASAHEGLAWVDVRPDVDGALQRRRAARRSPACAVWQAGCNGYYRTPSGRIVTQWPYSMKEFRGAARSPTRRPTKAPERCGGSAGRRP